MKTLENIHDLRFLAHFLKQRLLTLLRLHPARISVANFTILVFTLFSVLALPTKGTAVADYTQICDAVAHTVARETGVPASVLQAITRTETGRKRNGRMLPWPWTVNMEGKGMWFDTEDEARAYVFRNFKRGARSFDVGCFQINYKWHGQAFKSIEQMFEPLANARYAAKFLQELYAETGDWSDAAGAYHSRTPKYANRYKAIFNRYRTSLENTPPPVTILAQAGNSSLNQNTQPRINRFPLLQAGLLTSNLGSLVPLNNQSATGALFSLVPQPEG